MQKNEFTISKYHKLTDEQIIDEIKNGNEEALVFLLEKYKDEGPVLIEESISKEEIKYRKAKKIVEQEKEMEGTAEEKVKALGISISTLRRAKVEVEQYENLKKDERNIE